MSAPNVTEEQPVAQQQQQQTQRYNGHHNQKNNHHFNKGNNNESNYHHDGQQGMPPHMMGQHMPPYYAMPMIPGQIPPNAIPNYNQGRNNNNNQRNSYGGRNSKGGYGPNYQNKGNNNTNNTNNNVNNSNNNNDNSSTSSQDNSVSSPTSSSDVNGNVNQIPQGMIPQNIMAQEPYAHYGYMPYMGYPYPYAFNGGFPPVPMTQGMQQGVVPATVSNIPNASIPVPTRHNNASGAVNSSSTESNTSTVTTSVSSTTANTTATVATTANNTTGTASTNTIPQPKRTAIKITRPDGTPTEFGAVDKTKTTSLRTSVVSQPTSPTIPPSVSTRSSTTSNIVIEKPPSRGISIINPNTNAALDLSQIKKSRSSLAGSTESLKKEESEKEIKDIEPSTDIKKTEEEKIIEDKSEEVKENIEKKDIVKEVKKEEKVSEEKEILLDDDKLKSATSPIKSKKERVAELTKITTQPEAILRLESFDKVSYPPDIPSTPSREQGMPYKYNLDFLKSFAEHLKERPKDLPSDVDIYGDDSRGNSPRVRGGSRNGSISGGSFKSSEEKDKLFQAALRAKSQQKSGQFGMQFGMRLGKQGSGGSKQGSYGKPGSRSGRSGSGRSKNKEEKRSNEPPVEPLKRSENAWTPSMLKSKNENLTEEEKQAENVRKSTQGLLNKLTVEMFGPIVLEFLAIPVENEELLAIMIDRIFNKALDEPTFGRIYAQLCRELLVKLHEIQPWIGDGKNSLFRRALLKKCQSSFQKDEKWNEQKEDLLQAKREARTKLDTMTDEEKTALAEKEYELQKVQRRVLGNISFIGELFREGLITEKIMHICIGSLIKSGDPSEEEVECLCQLLTTIGSILDTGESIPRLNYYFEDHIKDLATSTTLSSRVRFMVMDLMDLRKSGWKDTKSEGPKSIAEIRREEEKRREDERKDRKDRFRDRSGHHDHEGRSSHGSDGWSVSGKESLHRSAGDLSKVGRFQKPSTNLSLSPASNLGSGAKGWGKKEGPINGTTKSNFTSNKNAGVGGSSSASITSTNSFAVLEAGGDEDRKPKEFTESDARSKFKGIIEEWFSLYNPRETVDSLKDLPLKDFNNIFIEMVLQKSWDRNQKSVDELGPMLVKLAETEIITKEQLIISFNGEFELLDDYSIDIPSIFKNVGRVLGELFDSEILNEEDLKLHEKIIFENNEE